MKKTHILASFAAAALAMSAYSAPTTFDFKDPKGVNNIVFLLDAPLESINGTGAGITGTASCDPENPGSVTGTIFLAVDSRRISNYTMQERAAMRPGQSPGR
jgi:hypothetical protein